MDTIKNQNCGEEGYGTVEAASSILEAQVAGFAGTCFQLGNFKQEPV